MIQRLVRPAALAAALLLTVGIVPAQKYDYGGGYGSSSEKGVVLLFEGMIMNPRNTDNVVATDVSDSTYISIIPVWDDDFAGRIGVGYRWASGSKILFSAWGFQTESQGTRSGDEFAFSIGPTFEVNNSTLGQTGDYFDIKTEITARTADLTGGREHWLTDDFILEWAAGVQYASYEETAEGFYLDGVSLNASKSNEGTMLGIVTGLRASYRLKRFSFNGGLRFSFLDGELDASSGLGRTTVSGLESFSALTDDSRSGTILDVELTGAWHSKQDGFKIVFGWEQQVWDGIAEDLMRNLPERKVFLRDRDSVTFSGFKVGFHFLF